MDGYIAFDIFVDTSQTRLLERMAHARRKFKQTLNNTKELAEYVMEKFKQLYLIERPAIEMTYDQRKELREEQSRPILNEMRGWMQEKYKEALPKSAIALAISYSLHSRERLIRYLEDGRYEIDNNWVENGIRPGGNREETICLPDPVMRLGGQPSFIHC